MLQIRDDVLAVVLAVPEGRVTTYGAIAVYLGATARQVAAVLSGLTAEESAELPWHRVVAASGAIATTKRGPLGRRQITRLEAEGVGVNLRNRVIDFNHVFWTPE